VLDAISSKSVYLQPFTRSTIG